MKQPLQIGMRQGIYFVMTSDPNQADIIATEMNDGNTQAAGEANSTTNLLTNYYSSVTVCLNSFIY